LFQPENLENMSRKIKVWMTDMDFLTLDPVQSGGEQTFELAKTSPMDHIKITISSTFGGKNASAKLVVIGVRCSDEEEKEKEKKEANEKALGIVEVLKPVAKSCDDDATMTSDKMIVSCLQSCPADDSKVTEVAGKYTLNSKVCVAAQIFYKEKEEAKQKDFGVLRIKNQTEKAGGTIPPYLFTFDASITKIVKKFQVNAEVDVLDPKLCWIRAKIVEQSGDSVKINYNKEIKSFLVDNV